MTAMFDRSDRCFSVLLFTTRTPIWILVLAALAATLAVSASKADTRLSPLEHRSIHDHWESYKARYRKTYSSHSEESERRNLRQLRLEKIHKHNRLASAGQYDYVLRENHLIDLTPQEYHNLLGYRSRALLSPSPSAGRRPSRSADRLPTPPIYRPTVDGDRLPTCVNWTARGWVGPVRTQGRCGSCWSYSAVGALQSQYYNVTGKSVQLSEQNLLDCTDPYGNMGCNGGNMQNAFWYVQKNGIQTLQQYPSESSLTGVSGRTCQYNSQQSVLTISHWQNVERNNELALREVVALVGPVSAALDTSSVEFQTYGGGIYHSSTCGNTDKDVNHAVLVVGYGIYKKQPYWLIQNTWGTEWGINGYMMLARNANNMCGIGTDATFPVIASSSNFSSAKTFRSESICPTIADAFPSSSTSLRRPASAALLYIVRFVTFLVPVKKHAFV